MCKHDFSSTVLPNLVRRRFECLVRRAVASDSCGCTLSGTAAEHGTKIQIFLSGSGIAWSVLQLKRKDSFRRVVASWRSRHSLPGGFPAGKQLLVRDLPEKLWCSQPQLAYNFDVRSCAHLPRQACLALSFLALSRLCQHVIQRHKTLISFTEPTVALGMILRSKNPP